MAIGLGLLDLAVLLLSLCVFTAVAVPLTGVLIRFRANYNPKALQLDNEGGAQLHTGPVINSYFGMFKRVYQLEGVMGLYKGLMPTFLSTFIVSLILTLFTDNNPRHNSYRAPDVGILATFFYAVGMMLISLPTTILTCRAITTPHRLSFFNAAKALRVLLTPTERRKPWIIYLTPGLLTTQMVHIGYVVFVLGTTRRLLLPVGDEEIPAESISWWALGTYLAVLFLSTFILTPLEVVSARLAIQRNHATAEFNSISQEEEGDADEQVEYASADEDVIGLRSEQDPYLGLVDCVKLIIHEEGWRALYRGWWVTLLGGGASATM